MRSVVEAYSPIDSKIKSKTSVERKIQRTSGMSLLLFVATATATGLAGRIEASGGTRPFPPDSET